MGLKDIKHNHQLINSRGLGYDTGMRPLHFIWNGDPYVLKAITTHGIITMKPSIL